MADYTTEQQIADLQARNTELVEANRKLRAEIEHRDGAVFSVVRCKRGKDHTGPCNGWPCGEAE